MHREVATREALIRELEEACAPALTQAAARRAVVVKTLTRYGRPDPTPSLSVLEILRDASTELQIILLTGNPWRFSRAHVDSVVDVDHATEASRRARDPGTITR